VTKLKHAGRLVLADDGRVDVAASVRRIEATRGARHDVEARWEEERGKPSAGDAAGNADATGVSARDAGDDEASLSADQIGLRTRLAQMRQAEADARAKERRDAVESGALVSRQDVERDMTEARGVMLNALESVPDRLAPLLTGIDDQSVVRAMVRDELERLQHTVASELGRIARRDG